MTCHLCVGAEKLRLVLPDRLGKFNKNKGGECTTIKTIKSQIGAVLTIIFGSFINSQTVKNDEKNNLL